jgi:hypothetical protein
MLTKRKVCNEVEVFVHTLTGRKLSITIALDDTRYAFKQQVRREQHLVDGFEMDDFSLFDHGEGAYIESCRSDDMLPPSTWRLLVGMTNWEFIPGIFTAWRHGVRRRCREWQADMRHLVDGTVFLQQLFLPAADAAANLDDAVPSLEPLLPVQQLDHKAFLASVDEYCATKEGCFHLLRQGTITRLRLMITHDKELPLPQKCRVLDKLIYVLDSTQRLLAEECGAKAWKVDGRVNDDSTGRGGGRVTPSQMSCNACQWHPLLAIALHSTTLHSTTLHTGHGSVEQRTFARDTVGSSSSTSSSTSGCKRKGVLNSCFGWIKRIHHGPPAMDIDPTDTSIRYRALWGWATQTSRALYTPRLVSDAFIRATITWGSPVVLYTLFLRVFPRLLLQHAEAVTKRRRFLLQELRRHSSSKSVARWGTWWMLGGGGGGLLAMVWGRGERLLVRAQAGSARHYQHRHHCCPILCSLVVLRNSTKDC